jgi:hypothetical protein
LVSYRSAFGYRRKFLKSRTKKIFQLPQATPEALLFFLPLIERKESRFRNQQNPFVSYKRIPTVTSEKRVQALDTEDTALSASTADYEFHPHD